MPIATDPVRELGGLRITFAGDISGTGTLEGGNDLVIPVELDPDVRGPQGLSAYQVWLAEGNTGTEQDFIDSLEGATGAAGAPGARGIDGESAYQAAVRLGFVGTEQEWIASLKGDSGTSVLATITDLRAFTGPSETVFAQGALFTTDSTTDHGLTDDGIYTILDASGRAWTRIDQIGDFADLATAQAANLYPYTQIYINRRRYARRATQPSHILRVQGADGAHFEIDEDWITSTDGEVHRVEGQQPVTYISNAWGVAYQLGRPFRAEHDEVAYLFYDVEAGRFSLDDEAEQRALFDTYVRDGKRTDQDISFYNSYLPSIERGNGYKRVLEYLQTCEYHHIGDYALRPRRLPADVGGIRVWMLYSLIGMGKMTRIRGGINWKAKIKSAIYGTDTDRPTGIGAEGYRRLTLTLADSEDDIPDWLVTGMAINLGEHATTAANPTANGITAMAGCAHIFSVNANKRSMIVNMVEAQGPATLTGSTLIVNDGTEGLTDEPYGQISANEIQFLVEGGFDDRRNESMISNKFFARCDESFITYVDHIDPDLVQEGEPGDPETKGRHNGNHTEYYGDTVDICGFSGRAFRSSIFARVNLNRCGIGGVGKFTPYAAERGMGIQLGSDVHVLRSSIGNCRSVGAIAGAYSRANFNSCNIANCAIGLQTITGAMIECASSIIQRCTTGLNGNHGSTFITDAGTIIEGCGTGITLNGNARVSGTDPTLQFNTTDWNDPAGEPITDLVDGVDGLPEVIAAINDRNARERLRGDIRT